MKNSSIYKIDVLTLDFNGKTINELILRQRTWGFYHDLETAQQCVLENWTDIFENNYYNFALISEMPTGVCVSPTKQWWYQAVQPKNSNKILISLYHTSLTREDRKKDPINSHIPGTGSSFLGW